MARIRQIKPEFWSSPSTASASAVARLLYIAMWNWADDSGHGTANLKELEGFAFPHDDVAELSGGKCRSFRTCVAEVIGSFGVVFYEVGGRPYFEIPTWTHHQRNERLANGKYPLPGQGQIVDLAVFLGPEFAKVRKMSEVPHFNVGSSAPVSGEQGIRGTVRLPHLRCLFPRLMKRIRIGLKRLNVNKPLTVSRSRRRGVMCRSSWLTL